MEEKQTTSLRSQSASILFAKWISFLLAFIFPLILVRTLNLDRVGLFREIFQLAGNLAAILPLGFSLSAYYYLAREERRKSTVFNIVLFNLAMGALGFVVLTFFPGLLNAIFRNDELTSFAPLIGVLVWLWIFSTMLETVALANQETKLATMLIIGSQFSKTVLMIAAVWIFASVKALVYAAIIQTGLQTLVLLYYLKIRFPRYWRSFDAKFFREHLAYALPFGLAGLLWTLQSDIHNYFVAHRFSEEEYAIYAYGCFQIPLIAMLSDSVTAVLIPRMSQLNRDGKTREMLELTVRAAQKLSFFFFPLYAFLFITAHEFITTLFTAKFEQSVPIFLVNLTLLPFYITVLDPLTRAFKELGRILLAFRVAVFIVLIAALTYGIRSFSLRGMVGIVVAATIFESIFLSGTIAYRIGVRGTDLHLLKGVGKTAVAAAIAGIALLAGYFVGRDFIFEKCLWVSRSIFSFVSGERLADFFGGSLFLFVCLLLFAPIYLFAANRLGLIDDTEKERLAAVRTWFGNLLRRRSAEA